MLIFSMLFLLLSNAVTLRRDKSIVYTRTSIIILLYSSLLVNNSCFLFSMNGGIALYSGLFHVTNIIQVFHLFIFLISALILQITSFYPLRIWLKNYSSILKIVNYDILSNKNLILDNNKEQFSIIEYPLIMLFIITGSTFLISTSDLVSIFLSIELQSYGLYLLSTLYRNSESATSAGLTYFLLGGLSSCFIVLGTSLLYSNSGLTNLDGLYVINSLNEIIHNNSIPLYYNGDYINTSLLILSVGFLFKVSAAPFHFWSPDVYDAVPTIVTTFIAIVAKISILVFFLELVYYTNTSLFTSGFSWTNTLLISSLLSLIIGTVLGLTQFRIKRLFAYSTISHLGFILLATTVNSIESTQAFIFYLMQYSLSNLNIFLLLLSMGYLLYNYINNSRENLSFIDERNSPIQFISQIKGFFYINPILSISFAITIFSFVGIPPLIGFFAKQMVLSAALDKGYVFITLLAILTSVVSAVYYLNVIRQMFFDRPNYVINPLLINVDTYVRIIEKNNLISRFEILPKTGIFSSKEKITSSNIVLSSYLTITVSAITLTILLFIFIPQEWLSMANILALTLNNP